MLSNNARYDKETKLNVYERNGISEYFIVEPETKEVWHYLLTNGTYVLQVNSKAGKLTSTRFGIEVNF